MSEKSAKEERQLLAQQKSMNETPAIIIYLEGGNLLMKSAFTPDQTQLYLLKMLFISMTESTKKPGSIFKPPPGLGGIM